MDPRVAGAGAAMALGMMLLLPTFNALNNSYVENVQPPPWMPTPDEIPDDFEPPPDWKPPEDWVPPEDFEPPPGWEPPPDYDGPIPPGGCPPPVLRYLENMNKTGTIQPQWDGESWTFNPPPYTVAIVANATFTDWQAQSVFAEVDPPADTGLDPQSDGAQGDSGGLLVPAQPVPETEFTLSYVAESEETVPPQGTYTLSLGADLPISGSYRTSVLIALPCGGMLE